MGCSVTRIQKYALFSVLRILDSLGSFWFLKYKHYSETMCLYLAILSWILAVYKNIYLIYKILIIQDIYLYLFNKIYQMMIYFKLCVSLKLGPALPSRFKLKTPWSTWHRLWCLMKYGIRSSVSQNWFYETECLVTHSRSMLCSANRRHYCSSHFKLKTQMVWTLEICYFQRSYHNDTVSLKSFIGPMCLNV